MLKTILYKKTDSKLLAEVRQTQNCLNVRRINQEDNLNTANELHTSLLQFNPIANLF